MSALAVDEMTLLPPPTVPPTLPEPPRPPRFEQSIDLAALPTALLCTRLFVASTLQRWGARFLEADAELLAVELVRHAVETCGVADEDVRLCELDALTIIRVRLLGFERTIDIEVWDSATELARLPTHPKEGELRGLGLVDARAKDWGSAVTPGGRVVWAELDVYERTRAELPRRAPRRSFPRPPVGTGAGLLPDVDLLRRVRDGLSEL
jgi:hypothetical protein